ncbi:hypothetical protein [Apilactobacillus ozensis]|uniref:hypothetical protein n=1 Tax=Apilactobacillus ozensis TaxID=866801 RepID=UPI00200AA6B3|nr:hypothetical protein [Apilactobacillus ozensis]MCK8607032.1 hypothetical protein [Apilactobacillus ozensis]
MATDTKKDNRTQDEIREATITYSDEDINRGIDLIQKKGFVTRKDFKSMEDDVWARGFAKHLDKKFQDMEDVDPYLYIERFDFKGGKLDDIIFDMDKITTREDALKTLSRELGEGIVR